MASKKKKICHLLSYLMILIYLQRIQAMNTDCGGKAFHCVNSTHFLICVDFGGGISKTVDEFIIQCPSTTVCRMTNRFECEYQLPTTTELATLQGEETKQFEINESIITISASRETNVTDLLGKYLNTVDVTTQTDFITDKQTEKPGSAVEIKDSSTDTMNILSIKGLTPKISFLNNSEAEQLLKLSKDKKLFQEPTTLPNPEKSIHVKSKGLDRKTSDLINGSSTSHVQDTNDGVETFNETEVYAKSLDALLYKKTESKGFDSSTLSSQDSVYSNNINFVNATISTLPDDSILPTSTESVKKVNIFEKSTRTTTKTLSSDIVTSEKLLTSIMTTETTLTEDVHPTMEGVFHFEDSFSNTENSTWQDKLISETKTEKMVTERTLVFTTTLENNTIPTFDGNILKETSSTVIPVSNNMTSFTEDDVIIRHSMITLKPEIKSIADVKGTIKATKQINHSEVTTAAPYLIITDHVMKEDEREGRNGKIFNTTHFSRNHIPAATILSLNVSVKITDTDNTTVNGEITRTPNHLKNTYDNNYNSLKTIFDINGSVPSYQKLLSIKNRNIISIDPEFTTKIFPINDNSEIELINLAQGINVTSTFVNAQTDSLGQDQVGTPMTWIDNLNVSSTIKPIILYPKSTLSTFEPISVITNTVADSVSSLKIKEETPLSSNDINENKFSIKKVVQLTTDKFNMKENLTRGSVNESYVTESGQITTVSTIHQISISKDITDTALDNTMAFSNTAVLHTLQDKMPVEMTTTEINKFSRTQSASKRFPLEPIIKTINSIVDQSNNVNNEKLQSIESGKKINEFISIKDQRIIEEPTKKEFHFSSTTLPSTSPFADKNFAPNVFTITTKTTTETSEGKENVLLFHKRASEQVDSEKLGILSNLVTETIVPNVLKPTDNTVGTNTYGFTNSLQSDKNSPVTPSVPKKMDMLLDNHLFSIINNKTLWSNFTMKNTSSEGRIPIYTKNYNQESSSHQNGEKITMNDKKIVNFEEISDTTVYSFLSKYQSPLPVAEKQIQEMFTTDVSIKVDDYNILGSEIFNNNSSSNNNTDAVHTINNVIEKPIIIGYPQQPKEVKDPIKNIIPSNFHSTSTIKAAHIYSVLSNVASDEPKNKSNQKEIDNQEKFSYGLNETSTSYTVAQTNNLLNNMLSTEMYTKSIKTKGVESPYPTKKSVTENINTNTDVNKILPLSSSISENITFEKEYKELHNNNTQIDYLLTDVNQNISKVSGKYDSLKTDVSFIGTEKNNMLYLHKIAPTSSTYKALSTIMPNLYVKVSNKLSVTDTPTSSSLTVSDKMLLHKVKNNSTVKDVDGNNTDLKYEHLNNIASVSNQTLSSNDTSTFSTGNKVGNFKNVSINTDTIFDTSYIKKVNMELLTPKLQENIQVTASYKDVPTTSIQPINDDTGSINIAKRSDGLIGRSPVPNLTLNGITETKNNINNGLNYFYNDSITLSTDDQNPELRKEDVKGNYIVYKLSNSENKIRTIQEFKKIQEEVERIQNFKYTNPVPTKKLDVKASFGDNGNGYLSKQITPAQSAYTAKAEFTNNSLNNKGAGKSFTNDVQFTCRNKLRGRYANKNDCRKFYICIGKIQSLLGECPVNTVFSEIKKQCTKNLSHCIINNQFHCIQDGRFSDVLKNNIYYICVKNKSTYIRYQFQCQSGYHFNKNNVRCVNDRQIQSQMSSTSLDNDSNKASDQSTVERKSKDMKQTDLITEKNTCKYEGKFWDPDDCRRYYVCSKNSKSIFRRRAKKCDSDEVFHREKKKCVNEDSYECK